MAFVYEATHLELRQKVALKFLNDQYRAAPDASSRFVREARAQFSLRSEHVGRVLDVARTESGQPCIVMELLEGQSLKEILDEQPRLAVPDAIAIMLQVCEGVAEGHALGIVHRDLKPSNIFVTRSAEGAPTVKVIDFGLAKARDHASEGSLTAADMLIGTPRYMAPEQFAGAGNARAYTDVWALGIVLYRLVTGELPFDGPHPLAIAARIRSEDPTSPSRIVSEVPHELSAVILTCLARDVARRYPDAGALARALSEVVLGTAVGRLAATRTGAVRSLVPERFAAASARATHDRESSSSGAQELTLLGADATEMVEPAPISYADRTRALGSHAVVLPKGVADDASSFGTSGTSETRIATVPPPAPLPRRASVAPPATAASAPPPNAGAEPMVGFGAPTFLPPSAPLPMTPRDGVPAAAVYPLPPPIEEGDELQTRLRPARFSPPPPPMGARVSHVRRPHAPPPPPGAIPRPLSVPPRGPMPVREHVQGLLPPALEDLRAKVAAVGPLGLAAIALFLVLLVVAIVADSSTSSRAPRPPTSAAPPRPAQPSQRSLGR